MKIVFLSFFSGKVYRGAETFVHEIGNGLSDLDNEVVVLQSGEKIKGSRYKTVRIESKNLRDFSFRALANIPNGTDVVFPNNGRYEVFFCKVWSVLHGSKVAVVGHSGPGFDDRLNLLLFPDVFIALTRTQEEWAKKTNRFVRVEKISDGVNTEIFRKNGDTVNFGLPGPIILCVSALSPIKRVDLAIKAVSKLAKGSLVVVGKGPEESAIRSLGNRLLPKRFKILSASYDKMPAIYRSADIFTFPTSPWESTGLSLFEAMASNLPVVCSDDPIRREIVGEAGVFVDPEDESEYSNGLEVALNKKWGNISRKRAENFSWREIAREYMELFSSMARK